MKVINGSIASPLGFQAQGVACGIKKNGGRDLALVVSDVPAACAAVFTRNLVKGHSLQRSMDHVSGGLARAVIVNSGNANACVGPQGDLDAMAMAMETARLIGCPTTQILLNSTGVIGHPLPMDRLLKGIENAVRLLERTDAAGHAAEEAIMTTDTMPKEVSVVFQRDGRDVTVSGMAKGSGMIHPDMATMIGLITTDCAVDARILYETLFEAVSTTFNRVSVDGDTSVCDMVAVLANGMAGNVTVTARDPELSEAFHLVCETLARMVARDGEGATKLVEVIVHGARTAEDAYRIVQAVAKSPLVKTAMFGEDANWGRILTAAGYSGAAFDPSRCDIFIGDLQVCSGGAALAFDETCAKEILASDNIAIRLEMNEGESWDRVWTCDFSYDYVRINGSYRT
ncbi:MAG TPA: bifunctional glutamate N-acetyltransferase/amino-acid acetyltransferase ArgJ [Clostridia bacterium]